MNVMCVCTYLSVCVPQDWLCIDLAIIDIKIQNYNPYNLYDLIPRPSTKSISILCASNIAHGNTVLS